MYMAVDKLPQVLKEKWWLYVDDKDWPDLIIFEKWLSRIAFVYEGFSAFKGDRREEDRRSTNREKKVLENIELQCKFERERNEANAN